MAGACGVELRTGVVDVNGIGESLPTEMSLASESESLLIKELQMYHNARCYSHFVSILLRP